MFYAFKFLSLAAAVLKCSAASARGRTARVAKKPNVKADEADNQTTKEKKKGYAIWVVVKRGRWGGLEWPWGSWKPGLTTACVGQSWRLPSSKDSIFYLYFSLQKHIYELI